MPRPRIKPIVKGVIKSYVSRIENRGKTNRQLAVELRKIIFEEYQEIPPQESTLTDRLVPEARKSIDPKDRPWSILDIAKHSIPPETLPVVIKAWTRGLLRDEPLTIREVLWMSRLYYVLEGKAAEINMSLDELLADTAHTLATHEMVHEITGEQPSTLEDMWMRWLDDAMFSFILTGNDDVLKKVWGNVSKHKLDRYEVARVGIWERIYGEAQNEGTHSQEG